MSSTSWIVDEHVLRAITWALVHFLWQGTVLAAVLAITTRALRSSSARYAAGVVTLFVMAAAPVFTFMLLMPADLPAGVADRDFALATATAHTALTAPAPTFQAAEATAASWTWFTLVPALWFTGVMVLAARLAGGWIMTRRLVTRDVSPVTGWVERMAREVARRLALPPTIRVVESARVQVPAMVGWLRPVVLLPAATIVQLSPSQLEALIAHEMVHIRRRDYLVNALQMAVEAVLFFHPAVWWVSRYVRSEREHCCDDEVVTMCDRMDYASALARLVEAGQVHVALAATDGSVLRRIQRLLERREPVASGWTPMLVAVLMTAGLAPIGLSTQAGAAPAQVSPVPVVAVAVAPQSVPAPLAPVAVPATPVVAPSVPPVTPMTTAPVAVPAQPATADEQALVRAQLTAVQTHLEDLAQEQAQLERVRQEAQASAQIETAREELQEAREALTRTQELVDTGRSPRPMAEMAQARVRTLERSLAQLENEAVFQRRNAELQQERTARMAEYDALRQRHARLVIESEMAKQQADDLRLKIERERDTQLRAAEQQQLSAVENNAAILPGDVIRIAIEEEADLPSTYVVSDNGAIRLPLLGRFVVQGRNAADLREEIRKSLHRTGLIPAANVSVQVTRRR